MTSSGGGQAGRREIPLEEIEDAVVDGDSPISTGTAASALRHRTFRIVFFGAFASNIGSWMQNVVLGAYAYTTTHSSTFVGVIIFAQLGPALLLAPLGGLLADKVDRKKFLVGLSIEQLVFSLAVALVVRSPSPSHVLLVAMVVMVGAGNALYAPTYSAILPGLVGREDLPGAISLNSTQMNASRVIGPIIGSVAYHFVGPAWVFTANAATYLFVVAALGVVTLPVLPPATRPPVGHWRDLWAGVAAARADRVVGRCLLTVFLFSLLALAFIGQMPVVAAHNLDINPKSSNYGVLYACFGTGALLGSLSIGTVFTRASKPMIVRVCLFGYALALTAFALLRQATPAYFVVALVGAFYFAFITALNTTLQAQLDDGVRGRVMALWIMGFGGTVALGNVLVGPIVAAVGITAVLLFGAGIALALVFYADVRPPLTPAGELGAGLAR